MSASKAQIKQLVRSLHNEDYENILNKINKEFGGVSQQDKKVSPEILLIYCIAKQKILPTLSIADSNFLHLRNFSYKYQELVTCELSLLEILGGDPSKALEFLKDTPEDEKNGTYYSRYGTANLLIGNYSEALEAYQQAISLEPERADHYNNQGGALVRLLKFEDALVAYEQCLNLQPDHPQANQSKIQVSVQLNKGDEIISQLQTKAENEPDNIQYQLSLFNTYVRFNMDSAAITFLRSKLDDFTEIIKIKQSDLPQSKTHVAQVNYRLNLIELLRSRKLNIKALALTNQILAFITEPGDSLILLKVGILTELGFCEEARTLLQTIETSSQINRNVIAEVNIYLAEGKETQALECLSAIDNDDATTLALKSRIHLLLGDIEASQDYLLKLSSANIFALASLINDGNHDPSEKIIERLNLALGNPLLPVTLQNSINFALSKCYDKQKNSKESFRYLRRGNELMAERIKYKPKSFTIKVNCTIKNYKPGIFLQHKKLPKSKPKPIFIVGMPRSGTTLTETIIGAHADVLPCGELDTLTRITSQIKQNYPNLEKFYPFCLGEISRDQLISMANAYINNLPDNPNHLDFITDKMPHNFMNVGLIHLLFPESPIIHVMRDPRDTGLSNYQQNFEAKYGGLGYSCDLEHIGKQINDYHRMMQHWRTLEIPMFEFWYEDLVENQELMTRKFLNYCGLAWDPATLSFHELERSVRTASITQVRKKMYKTSSSKWKRFEEELAPMINVFNMDSVVFYSKDQRLAYD